MNEPAISVVVDGPPEGLHTAKSQANDAFATALNFLRKDNEYRANFTQKQIAESTNLVESVNAAVLVATFIAGVQTQIIALTKDKNDTRIQVAANAIGFLGLAFDILGASQGVMHAVNLKKMISETRAAGHPFMDNERLNRIRESLDDAPTNRQQIQELLLEEMRESKIFWGLRRILFTSNEPGLQEHLLLLFPTDAYFSLGAQLDETLRQSPIHTIGYGVFFLLISVLCFARYSQPRAVWITCVVLALTFGLSFIWAMMAHNVIRPSYDGSVVQNLEQASEMI